MLAALRFLSIVGALIFSGAAFGASQSGIPSKFNIPWGNSAGSAYIRVIPQSSQIGVQNCAASLTDGFPPLTFTPAAGGGCPPFGQDFNGILNQITKWNQWQSMGGPVFYDSALSSAIGGYPKGAVLMSSILQGRLWFSTADNNTTNPDDQTGASANWIALPGTAQAGHPIASLSTTILPNTVSANGQTVGNASSNATGLASTQSYWLFLFLWNNCANCTLFNSGGGVVGRGATAQADWNANNAIATVNMNGATLMGADSQHGTTSTNLNNVPVTSGSRTVPTSVLGENLHTLSVTEMPSHSHTDAGHQHGYLQFSAGSGTVGGGGAFGANISANTNTGFANIQNTGGGGAHNNVSLSIITYWNLAL